MRNDLFLLFLGKEVRDEPMAKKATIHTSDAIQECMMIQQFIWVIQQFISNLEQTEKKSVGLGNYGAT